jgi:hypothetical protein
MTSSALDAAAVRAGNHDAKEQASVTTTVAIR